MASTPDPGDFSARPFVAGSLVGIRSFKIDKLGRLTGVSYPAVWRPGENEARCLNPGPSYMVHHASASMYMLGTRPNSSWWASGGSTNEQVQQAWLSIRNSRYHSAAEKMHALRQALLSMSGNATMTANRYGQPALSSVSYAVRDYGRVLYEGPFHPGDILNGQIDSAESLTWVTSLLSSSRTLGDPVPVPVPVPAAPAPPEPPEPSKVKVAEIKCSCGYYAYFDDKHNPYHNDGQIVGIVEGYGTVTVGSRGFRAAKAKILGLVVPEAQRDRKMARVMLNYKSVPLFTNEADAVIRFPLTPPDAPPDPTTEPDFWTIDPDPKLSS